MSDPWRLSATAVARLLAGRELSSLAAISCAACVPESRQAWDMRARVRGQSDSLD